MALSSETFSPATPSWYNSSRDVPDPMPGRLDAAGAVETRTRRPQILWIDDEVTPTDALLRLLNLAGFSIDSAGTAREGLALVRTGIHDLIVLDERLPDGSGLEILARLRLEGVSLPMILVTGYPDNEIGIRAMKLGASDVRFKPLDDEEMAVALRAALAVASSNTTPGGCSKSILGKVLAAVESCRTSRAVLTILLRAMVHDDTDLRYFLAYAAGFRAVRSVRTQSVPRMTSAARKAILDALLVFHEPTDVRLRQFLQLVRSLPKRRSESEWARDVGLDRSHFSGLLNEQVGVSFHVCRSTAVLRSALRQLLGTREHVGLIADGLGYQPSQLVHELRALIGLSGRELRSLSDESQMDHFSIPNEPTG